MERSGYMEKSEYSKFSKAKQIIKFDIDKNKTDHKYYIFQDI